MLVTLTIAGLLLAPAPAPPSPRPLREALRVEPGATCLTADALADAATTWLGRDTVDPSVARIDVRGDPARPHSVAIALEIRGELVERTLDPPRPTCSDLHALVGLAIAIAVDAAVLEGLGYEVIEPGEGSVPQAQDPERPPLQRRSRRGEASEGPVRRASVSVVAAVRGGAWLGVLPGLAGGGGAQLELGWRRWVDLRAGLFGGYGGPRAIDADTVVKPSLVGGRLDVCAALARPRVRPRLCFGAAGGALQSGAKTPGVQAVVAPWVALMVAPELRIWATKRFAIDFAVDLVVPVVRPVLAERDPSKQGMVGESLPVPPVGAVVSLGIAFTIR
ncbi:hypothetical protein OV203_00695 [Nannocystis sp. ILAH1]|uniref:hypothetical protein n=1 Tax=unclassified Nannocystis TaxID=2627009 RepID=UPI00226FF99E|nr:MULTISPECIES: hypothetical protein [unclassified Nannocystis]MCY0985627.1 hypothetical protein [Nannocystis sp. ILAH1]MCY1068314.1 hypothetical protein [Nannocystis sp. RBIL2]